MKRNYRLLAAAAAAGVLLTACGTAGAGSSYKTYENNGTFTMDLGSDPGSVNPYQSTGGLNRQIYAFSYDTLVGRDTAGKAVPQLASSWRVTPDKVTYTLRPGITCQDGTTLTAQDVAADFNYIKAPKTLSPWVQFSIPVGYTVSADEAAHTVTVKTRTPFGLLLQGAGSVPIVCPAGIKNPKSIEHASAGTGPFKITSYVPGDHYTMSARSDYTWGPKGAATSDPGTPKTVKIAFALNESTMANELLAGQINAAQITGPDRLRLDRTGSLKRVDIPVIVGEVNYNQATGRVFKDTALRLAATAALNRQQLTKVGTSSQGAIANNLVAEAPVTCPGDETTGSLPPYDVQKANQRLTADGWIKGSDGIRRKNGKKLVVKIIYQTGAPQTASAVELIGEELKIVGVGTNLVGLTNAAFLESLYTTADFDMYYSAINVDFPYMASTFFGGAIPPKGGRNSGDILNHEFDSLSAQAAATPAAHACPLWRKAHQSLLRRADVVPVSVGDRPFYTSKATLQTVGLFAVPTSIRLYK